MKATKFDQDFVNKLIRQKEGNTLDFKQKINSKEKIAKTISALANTLGGFILVGVSDQKKITGIDPEEERYMIETANEEYCFPRASLTFHEIKVTTEEHPEGAEEDCYVLLIGIEKTEGPLVYCQTKTGEKKAYTRVADKTLSI